MDGISLIKDLLNILIVTLIIASTITNVHATNESVTGPPPPSPVEVHLDNTVYVGNDTITISGKVQNVTNKEVLIQILNPKYIAIQSYHVPVSLNGTFTLKIKSNFGVSGQYGIMASLHNGYETSKPFAYIQGPYHLFVDGKEYLINYRITAGVIDKISADSKRNSLDANILNATGADLTIQLPREMMDALSNGNTDTNFTVLAGHNQLYLTPADFAEVGSNSYTRTLLIHIPYEPFTNSAGIWDIKIVGTKLVPEFGMIPITVLAMAVIGLIILQNKFKAKN